MFYIGLNVSAGKWYSSCPHLLPGADLVVNDDDDDDDACPSGKLHRGGFDLKVFTARFVI
jgi:hypothetical protein